eukprot:483818-Rhodomonas_salina.2
MEQYSPATCSAILDSSLGGEGSSVKHAAAFLAGHPQHLDASFMRWRNLLQQQLDAPDPSHALSLMYVANELLQLNSPAWRGRLAERLPEIIPQVYECAVVQGDQTTVEQLTRLVEDHWSERVFSVPFCSGIMARCRQRVGPHHSQQHDNNMEERSSLCQHGLERSRCQRCGGGSVGGGAAAFPAHSQPNRDSRGAAESEDGSDLHLDDLSSSEDEDADFYAGNMDDTDEVIVIDDEDEDVQVVAEERHTGHADNFAAIPEYRRSRPSGGELHMTSSSSAP